VGVGSAAKGATAWSTFSCGARWRRAGWSTSPPECPDMHLVEDRRVLHDRPTSAGVAAAAGSGGGVGVGAHKGSRFSSRLRGGPGSGGGGQRVGTRPPGADGSGHRRSTPGGLAGVGAGSSGRAGTRMAVRAPEASRCLVRSPLRSRRAVQEPRRPRPRPPPSGKAQQAAERPSRWRVQAVVPRVRPPPCPAPRCRAASGTRYAPRARCPR